MEHLIYPLVGFILFPFCRALIGKLFEDEWCEPYTIGTLLLWVCGTILWPLLLIFTFIFTIFDIFAGSFDMPVLRIELFNPCDLFRRKKND